MSKSILKKAAEKTLCDVLGFDEGRIYYLLLTKNNKRIKEQFSYSKRYRLLKSLFVSGAIGKIKKQENSSFKYKLLPPSFLHYSDKNKEIIEYLEGLYFKNYQNFIQTDFSQIIVKDDKGLVLFLLKYVMKKSAEIFGNNFNLSCLGKNKTKVQFNKTKQSRRRGIIDKRFKFEFSAIKGKNSDDYIGYISNNEFNDSN